MTDQMVVLVFLILAIFQFSMVVYFWHLSQRLEQIFDRGQKNQPDNSSWDLLHRAIKKSEAILGAAGLEEVKMAADSRFRLGKAEERYEQELDLSAAQVQEALMAEVAKATQEFKMRLSELTDLADRSEKEREQELKDRLDKLLVDFEQFLKKSWQESADRSLAGADLQMKAAARAIEDYKKKRFAEVDQKVVLVLEKALTAVIGKKLTLDDQMDLIYEALGKAKAEEFIS